MGLEKITTQTKQEDIPVSNLAVENQEAQNSDFEFFEDKIYSITEMLSDDFMESISHLQAGDSILSEEGVQITFPAERKGKHATVLFLTLEKEGKQFNCVLRDNISDNNEYAKNIEVEPDIVNYVPRTYGTQNNWVVIEKIDGYESEIKEKIKDVYFRSRYAEKIADVSYSLTRKNIHISDVTFNAGHNVIANDDGSFKFIEQLNLIPESQSPFELRPDELLTKRIYSNLQSKGLPRKRNSREDNPDKEKDYLYNLEFQFIKSLFQKVDPDNLFIKYRYITPDCEVYPTSFNSYLVNRDFWDKRNNKELGENEYENIQKKNLPWVGNFDSRSKDGIGGTKLNPDLIRSIESNDEELFSQLVYDKEIMVPMDDTENNRIYV